MLAAGALDSPAILLRSGIGPATELESLGIDVVRDCRRCGAKSARPPALAGDLHDHGPPGRPTAARCLGHPDPSVLEELARPRSARHAAHQLLGADVRRGSRADRGRTASRSWRESSPRRAAARSRLSGPGLDDPLQIDLQALADPDDVDALVASVRQCRSIGRRPALAEEWGAVEIYPGPEVSDDELEEYVRATAITYHHQVGTCRMGVDAEAVVDPRLRVHGIDGLRVIDASIMPRITTGNTNAPAALIGELGARFLLEDAGRP